MHFTFKNVQKVNPKSQKSHKTLTFNNLTNVISSLENRILGYKK